ncbi:MAG: bifunctional UDP-N-acetylglucosamine diphosphorylase/glucosamine-1-phosphate N-acetyltransferase GlmU [Vicinamibacterales bacterium]
MSDVHIVILAAGKGTRMKSARPKVLHTLAGAPMIAHVIDMAAALRPASMTVVVGHQAEVVRRALGDRRDLAFVVQEPQLGTAHALLTTEPLLGLRQGTLVLLSGDVPALDSATLGNLIETHLRQGAAATILTASAPKPTGLGRIIRDGGKIARIVEEKDASPAEREIREFNAGIYAFQLQGLFTAIRRIGSDNAQNEYYLPDLISVFRSEGREVASVTVEDASKVQGINSRAELASVGRALRHRKNTELMAEGVTLEDPDTIYVDAAVRIGADTVIHPGVSIEGQTVIGTGCEIHSGVRIVNSTIGDRAVVLNHCVVTDSRLGDDTSVGPFAHLRNEAAMGTRARVGNFVEMKKTSLGAGSKAMHLTYLGDASIGTQVNVGAGTITCNYDGVRKHPTTIHDGAFIGSDSQLIAPVTIGEGAYVGTGTTVREDVPPGALAVSAGRQRNIEGWVEKKRSRAGK